MNDLEPAPEAQPPAPADSRQRELFPTHQLDRLLEVERAKVERDNKRTEVMRLAVETSDASDKRQYDYHMAALEAERSEAERRDSLSQRRHMLGVWVVSITGLGFAAVLALLFYMSFLGEAEQRQTALRILTLLFTGVAGYGVLNPTIAWLRRLMSPSQK